MLTKIELGTLANDLISMGTDYLVNGLDEYTFKLRLKVYSDAAQKKEEAPVTIDNKDSQKCLCERSLVYKNRLVMVKGCPQHGHLI